MTYRIQWSQILKSCAILKSGTTRPIQKSKVPPVCKFYQLFDNWPENEKLSIKQLLFLHLFSCWDHQTLHPNQWYLTVNCACQRRRPLKTDQVLFHKDDSLTIKFLGVKINLCRDGFEVCVSGSIHKKLDPVNVLRQYIERTDHIRPEDKPVFMTLVKPFTALSSSSIASILCEAIDLAGLGGQGFCAKSLRPTGATLAIENAHKPQLVMKTEWWR